MSEGAFEHIRAVDLARLDAASPDERFVNALLDHASGAEHCSINYVRTPPGGGSPAGLHTHEVDQIFFVLSGTMMVEIAGSPPAPVRSSMLVVFPAGVPHRNWNDGPEPTVHLAINVPLPDPAKPFAVPAR